MYIIPATTIESFLGVIERSCGHYSHTFPHRRISNFDDIKYAAVYLYACGTPFARCDQPHYHEDYIPHLEVILAPFVEKIWKYFNETPNTDNTQTNFDIFHEELCDLFLEIIRRDGRFEHTYGNAQKMVNMLFKYLTCFADYADYADLFSYCHMPIDSKILGMFARIYGVPNTSETFSKGKYNGQYRDVCWSKMTKELYLQLLSDYRSALAATKGDHSWLGLEYYIWQNTAIPNTGTHAQPITMFYK